MPRVLLSSLGLEEDPPPSRSGSAPLRGADAPRGSGRSSPPPNRLPESLLPPPDGPALLSTDMLRFVSSSIRRRLADLLSASAPGPPGPTLWPVVVAAEDARVDLTSPKPPRPREREREWERHADGASERANAERSTASDVGVNVNDDRTERASASIVSCFVWLYAWTARRFSTSRVYLWAWHRRVHLASGP